VQLAEASAVKQGITNADFRIASAYELPFDDKQFDAVFSHALIEHLSEPDRAMNEFLRLLKPGGVMGVATPDWSGFLCGPSSPPLKAAVRAYEAMQVRNGGDVTVGHKLSQYAVEAGFERVRQRARYENFEPISIITDLLSAKLEQDGEVEYARLLRDWGRLPHAMFAEAWVACVGFRPA
jgi:ubiquinone/menaquinone biosynthesis C-methylase UbiE